jgi:hypothetical protein
MAMAPPRLLRGLIAPLPPSDWLPCNQLVASASSLLHRWLPSLALPRGCPDGFKLLLVLLLVSAARSEGPAKLDLAKLPAAAPGKVDFVRDIKPLFAAACLDCHGPAKQRAGLRLDDRKAALEGADSGPAPEPLMASTVNV